jgi:hypothetical protein
MSALHDAEQLRQQAIAVLLEERSAIEEALTVIGYVNGEPQKRRGRPPKEKAPTAEAEGAQITLPV